MLYRCPTIDDKTTKNVEINNNIIKQVFSSKCPGVTFDNKHILVEQVNQVN